MCSVCAQGTEENFLLRINVRIRPLRAEAREHVPVGNRGRMTELSVEMAGLLILTL